MLESHRPKGSPFSNLKGVNEPDEQPPTYLHSPKSTPVPLSSREHRSNITDSHSHSQAQSRPMYSLNLNTPGVYSLPPSTHSTQRPTRSAPNSPRRTSPGAAHFGRPNSNPSSPVARHVHAHVEKSDSNSINSKSVPGKSLISWNSMSLSTH